MIWAFSCSMSQEKRAALPSSSSYLRSLTKCWREEKRRRRSKPRPVHPRTPSLCSSCAHRWRTRGGSFESSRPEALLSEPWFCLHDPPPSGRPDVSLWGLDMVMNKLYVQAHLPNPLASHPSPVWFSELHPSLDRRLVRY